MPHHGNEAEHEANEAAASAASGEAQDTTASENSAADAQPGEGDALDQAQAILDAAGADDEVSEGGSAEASSDSSAEADGEKADEASELRTDLLRLQAEYVNYRKRVERDRAVAGENATIAAITALLPVLDDIDAARQHGDLEDGPFAAIAAKLETALKGLGLEPIRETGAAFDPTVHEALMQVPNAEIPADHVAQILRSGYRKGERIIRAAQVIVSTGE